MKLIDQVLLKLWSGMENPRWPPGGHIWNRITTKIDRAPLLTQPNPLCQRNMKSIKQPVLELWCGMWFAAADAETLWEHNAPYSTTLSGGIKIKLIDQVLHLSYGAEWKIRDGHLVAILEVGSRQKSIGHLPRPIPWYPKNMKLIG
jgi:hypothetical protein